MPIRWQALNRKLNVPRSFGHFRSDQADAQGDAQSPENYLALLKWPKLVLQTLGKLAIRLQALHRKLNVPRTFGHLRSDQADAQGEHQGAESYLALWNQPKLVLQTLGKLGICLQALHRKLNVPRTFGHFRSDQAYAQGEAQSAKSLLALWSSADSWQAGDSLASVRSQTKCAPIFLGTLGQTRLMCRGRPRVLKITWHFGIGPN